jgi:hypothetical protein
MMIVYLQQQNQIECWQQTAHGNMSRYEAN